MLFKAQLLTTYRICRRWSYKRLQQSATPVAVSLPQNKRMLLNPQGQIAEAIYVDRFERRERELAIKYLKPGMQVIDIGANVGLYSLIAAKFISPEGKRQ
jgi:predicted methyltransferase